MVCRNLLVLFGFAFWINPLSVSGQSDFSGEYTWGGLQGDAIFSYKTMNGDTILDGPFRMEHSDVNASDEKDNYFLIEVLSMMRKERWWPLVYGVMMN